MPTDEHEWYSVVDDDDTTWMFDLTFLTSDWACIWGRGCPGIHDVLEPDLGHGCCTYGAHFADQNDRQRVRQAAAELPPHLWQNSSVSAELGGPIHKDEDDDWVTRLVDGVCIFFNQPGFSNGAGCALHVGALQVGARPLDWKPEVCWQLPLRLEHHYDDNEHLVYQLREWKRRDWGAGGADLGWWCTHDDERAFVGESAVYLALRDEIVELVGPWAYDMLRTHLERRRYETPLPHPALRISH